MATYGFSSIDELGQGYGFRRVREPLGIEAFGANVLVMPPRFEAFDHYHDTHDELYFVHAGTARIDVAGSETREVGPGGLFHCQATLHRRISNAGEPTSSCSSSGRRTAVSSATATSSTRSGTASGGPASGSSAGAAAPAGQGPAAHSGQAQPASPASGAASSLHSPQRSQRTSSCSGLPCSSTRTLLPPSRTTYVASSVRLTRSNSPVYQAPMRALTRVTAR